MSMAQAQIDIRTEIERARLAFSPYTLLVDYENGKTVDLTKIDKGYLAVDLVWRDGDQLDMNPDPLTRLSGQILLAAGAKVGSGTAFQLAILDHFRPYLQLRTNLGVVRTYEAAPQPPTQALGFYYVPMIVGFWLDGVAPPVPL